MGSKIVLKEGKKEKEYSLIISFNEKENEYLIYTDNKIDDEKFIKTYVSRYEKKNNIEKLFPVEDEYIFEIAEKLLNKTNGVEV